MANGFTDEEVRAAVDKFLLRQVSVGTLSSGSRNVIELRDSVYDLITTVLLLRPDSFFYVVWQAGNKLKGLITKQIAALDLIAEQAPEVTRPAKKVNSTSELTNARAALLEINAGLAGRTQGVNGSLGPAVARFRRSINSFLNTEVTKNVVVGGVAVDTADGAKSAIRAAWSDAVSRHSDIVSLASNTSSALAELSAARLPQSAVKSLVSKIQARLSELEEIMAGPQALAESRQALLDLLTMRTLLTKASSFSAPSLVLMPLVGDGDTVSIVDSGGAQASVLSSLSAPYNYDPGATLSLSVNGGTPVVVALPRTSRAEIRSRPIAPWAEPPGASEILLSINGGGSSGPFLLPPVPAYGSGPDAAAAFDAALAGVEVTWDAGTNQLVFQSEDETDVSRIRLVTNTILTAPFGLWFGGSLLEGVPIPPTAEELVQTISSTSSLLKASVEQELYGTFTATREALPTNVVWNKLAQGTDLVTTAGSDKVTSPAVNFDGLLRPGMAIEITAPLAVAGQYVINAVDGGTLTIDASLAASTTATYFAGPDYRGVPAGARVHIIKASNSLNLGYYRVDAGGGLVARIPLTRPLASADAGLVISVYTKYVRIAAVGSATTSGLGVSAPNLVGFTPGPEVSASLTGFSLTGAGDLIFRGVRSGDRVMLTAPSSVIYERILSSVSVDSFVITQPVLYESGAWQFLIQSDRVYRYVALTDYPALVDPPPAPYVNQFLSSVYVTNFADLDVLIGRLIRGGVYSGQISTAISQYKSDLLNLKQALDSFSVPPERAIDNTVKTMREQGLDRAVDIFLALRLGEFFSMEPEGVSYSTWLAYQASRAARQVAPVSKSPRSALVYQEWRPLSFQTNNVDLRTIVRNRT